MGRRSRIRHKRNSRSAGPLALYSGGNGTPARAANPNQQITQILQRSWTERAKTAVQQPPNPNALPTEETAQTAFAVLSKDIKSRNEAYFKFNWPRIKPNVLKTAHTLVADWFQWRGKLRDRLALSVGSGPSLTRDNNLALLREISESGKYAIFAANRAYPILEKAGIIPDFVVVVDRTSPPIPQKHGTSTNLIATYETNWKLVKQWNGPKYMTLGGALDESDPTTNAKLKIIQPIIAARARAASTQPDIVRMSSGGNVGTFIFIILRGWFHCNLILHLGHDYGTDDPKALTEDPMYRPMRNFPDRFTKRDYIQYAKWQEEQYALNFQAGMPDVAVNCSLNGLFNLENYLPNILNIPFSEIQPVLMGDAEGVIDYLEQWRRDNPWQPITLSDE